VSLMAENNLKLLAFYCCFHHCTSDAIDVAGMTVKKIRAIEALKHAEKDHKDPEAPEIDEKDWPRTIEAMKEYFASCLGTTKIPLAYIIRKNLAPDPAPGTTHHARLIGRAKIVLDPTANPLRYMLTRTLLLTLHPGLLITRD
jgi:hypothetical protein